MKRSAPQPLTIATPTGGNSIVINTINRAGAPSPMFADMLRAFVQDASVRILGVR
jgi:hypothetical protein